MQHVFFCKFHYSCNDSIFLETINVIMIIKVPKSIKAVRASSQLRICLPSVVHKAKTEKIIDLVVARDFQDVLCIKTWFHAGCRNQSSALNNTKIIATRHQFVQSNKPQIISNTHCKPVASNHVFLYPICEESNGVIMYTHDKKSAEIVMTIPPIQSGIHMVTNTGSIMSGKKATWFQNVL